MINGGAKHRRYVNSLNSIRRFAEFDTPIRWNSFWFAETHFDSLKLILIRWNWFGGAIFERGRRCALVKMIKVLLILQSLLFWLFNKYGWKLHKFCATNLSDGWSCTSTSIAKLIAQLNCLLDWMLLLLHPRRTSKLCLMLRNVHFSATCAVLS